ncbi:MAG: glycosyltransferase [Eggerthellaceae bacterium]|nr:glycosyltransferase [Eggerthellaceae bacterium]
MIDYTLSNLLLENNERFNNFRNLYYFSPSPMTTDEERGGSTFMPYADYNFSTYFNSFSNKKWRLYTDIDNVHFRLEVKGSGELEFMGIHKRPVGLRIESLGKVRFDSPDEFTTVEFEFPDSEAELLSFKLVTFDFVTIKSGCYYSKIDPAMLHDVHLAIATTTFKKEEYVTANIDLFKNQIRGCSEPIAEHASMIVVDNGKTLDAEELSGDGVYVFPNKNVGGSGGFARGMIEALRLDDHVTHVLIMDDDVEFSAESIRRTYTLLTLVNDEYAEAFVSGAMFSLGAQQIQIEDIGYADAQGEFGAVKPQWNMDLINDILRNEDDLPHRTNMYAAFWYCCIPRTTIEREGLPLPLFIRYDDAEYGQRCAPKFMTMNGINVWHEDFVDRYSPFYERYCGMRNCLIIQATTGVCPGVDYMKWKFHENFKREIKKFNYGSAELLLDAVEDFLRGPEFIAQNRCEQILKAESAKVEKFVDLDSLDLTGMSLDRLEVSKGRTPMQRSIDAFTYNGQRLLPPFFQKKQPIAVRDDPNEYAGMRYRFRNRVLVVNRLDTKGVWRTKDKKKFDYLIRRYKAITKDYEKRHKEVEARYAAARDWLTSQEFWLEYLDC